MVPATINSLPELNCVYRLARAAGGGTFWLAGRSFIDAPDPSFTPTRCPTLNANGSNWNSCRYESQPPFPSFLLPLDNGRWMWYRNEEGQFIPFDYYWRNGLPTYLQSGNSCLAMYVDPNDTNAQFSMRSMIPMHCYNGATGVIYETTFGSSVQTPTFTATPTNTATPTITPTFTPVLPPDATNGCFWRDSNDVGHRYELITTPLSWSAAKTAAQARTLNGVTGYLADITNVDEQSCVYQLLTNSSNSTAWLGGSDDTVEGSWSWQSGALSGSAIATTYWAAGEPSQTTAAEDCLIVQSGGSSTATAAWDDRDCSDTHAYVVEYVSALGEFNPTLTPTLTPTYTPTLTPVTTFDWWFNRCFWREPGTNIRHRYEFVQKPATWAEAKADAESRYINGVRGHLVTLASAGEYSCVGTVISYYDRYNTWVYNKFWTAGRSVGTDSSYVWDSGSEAGTAVPVALWNNTIPSPDFMGGTKCVRGEGWLNAALQAEPCTIKYPYVIEFTAVNTGLDISPTPIASRPPVQTRTPTNQPWCNVTTIGLVTTYCTSTPTRHIPDIYPKTLTNTPTITLTPSRTWTPWPTATPKPPTSTPCFDDPMNGVYCPIPWETPTPWYWWGGP